MRYLQRLVRGDSYTWTFTYKVGKPAVATSVAGQGWRFTVRDGKTDAVLMEASVGSGITLEPGGVTGRVEILIASTNLAIGTHKYDLQQTVGGVVKTLVLGDFTVLEDQSR